VICGPKRKKTNHFDSYTGLVNRHCPCGDRFLEAEILLLTKIKKHAHNYSFTGRADMLLAVL